MTATDHYILKRSGWLLLLGLTRLSAYCFGNGLHHFFLFADFENNPPSSYMCDHELACYHCRRRYQRWEERAETEGIKTPFGTLIFKDENKEDQTTALIAVVGLGTFLAIGSAVLWMTRGVWGWWAVPTGLGIWATCFADWCWVGEKVVDTLTKLGVFDDDEEEYEEEEEDEEDEEEEEEDEDDVEDEVILSRILWEND
ncbi:hypothetical protein EAE96_002620 [Botrytis aclada]|nr:hypothetical protein EAE96_002620 [Botrytis aclada]